MTPIQRILIHDASAPGRLTPRLIEQLIDALTAESEARVVTLEGAGVFCEGLDLATLTDERASRESAAVLERFGDLLDRIATTPRPVVALVDGPARGGGLGLAAAADLVVATPRATFGLPEALFGLIPAMVFPVLARRVGATRARWLALSGASLPASEAWRQGLVDEVADDLDACVRGHVRRLTQMDPRAIAAVKAMAVASDATPAGYRADAAASFRRLAESEETRARITRFLAGDAPWLEAPES
jgi:enoyl-CoA hydratase/carnithine racemase